MTQDENIHEQLSAYLDGELDDARSAAVVEAVEADANLAAELKRLRTMRELLHSLPRESAPDGFVDRVLAQAERRNLIGAGGADGGNAAPEPWMWVRWVATAAVVLIAVGVGLVITTTLLSPSWEDHMAAAPEQDGKPMAKESHGREGDGLLSDATVASGGAESGLRAKGGSAYADSDPSGERGRGFTRSRSGVGHPGYTVLNGGAAAPVVLANVTNFDIYTPNPDTARRQLENTLRSNGIVAFEPVAENQAADSVPAPTAVRAPADARPREAEAKKDEPSSELDERGRQQAEPMQRMQVQNNTYQAQRLTPTQVQYVVYVDSQNKLKLLEALKEVRRSQEVSQIALTDDSVLGQADTPAAQPAKGARGAGPNDEGVSGEVYATKSAPRPALSAAQPAPRPEAADESRSEPRRPGADQAARQSDAGREAGQPAVAAKAAAPPSSARRTEQGDAAQDKAGEVPRTAADEKLEDLAEADAEMKLLPPAEQLAVRPNAEPPDAETPEPTMGAPAGKHPDRPEANGRAGEDAPATRPREAVASAPAAPRPGWRDVQAAQSGAGNLEEPARIVRDADGDAFVQGRPRQGESVEPILITLNYRSVREDRLLRKLRSRQRPPTSQASSAATADESEANRAPTTRAGK